MLLGAAGMFALAGLDLRSSYVADILPALLGMGVGIGLVISSSMNSATLGVRPSDAGVASATVNASQQVGGSLGTACSPRSRPVRPRASSAALARPRR